MKKIVFLLLTILMSVPGFCQKDLNIQMIYVKGASFFMGSDDPHYLSEEYDNERPIHRVSVSSYYIGKYEVTNGEWRRVMGVYPAAYNGVDYGNKKCDDCPVVKISWDEAMEFIRRLNDKSPGKHYRLPTETEWEYAARGGKYGKGFSYSGSNKLAEVGWYGRRNGTTHPQGQKEPNELSIYDMSGNVLEWVADWYSADYYAKTVDDMNPKGPRLGTKKVLRGGSYFTDDAVCRNTYRSRLPPDTRQWDIGFRLAQDVVEKPAPKAESTDAKDSTEQKKDEKKDTKE